MEENYRQKKTLDSTADHYGNPTNKASSSNQDELAKRVMNLPMRRIFVHTSQVTFTWRKYCDMGPSAVLPFRGKVYCGFLSPFKIHRLDRVLSHDPWVQWQSR
jgi:hypothetical protein